MFRHLDPHLVSPSNDAFAAVDRIRIGRVAIALAFVIVLLDDEGRVGEFRIRKNVRKRHLPLQQVQCARK